VVVPANDVRDLELDVVDDAGQVIGRGAVLAEERDPPEAVSAEARRRLAVELLTIALARGPFVPLDAQPLEIANDLLLSFGHVPRGIRVVDAQEEPLAEIAVGDSAESVPDVQ